MLRMQYHEGRPRPTLAVKEPGPPRPGEIDPRWQPTYNTDDTELPTETYLITWFNAADVPNWHWPLPHSRHVTFDLSQGRTEPFTAHGQTGIAGGN
jgi:hypothetical protein